MIKIISIIISIIISLIVTSSANAATLYMPDNCANLQACFSSMSSGDTLIIRDGTYTGTIGSVKVYDIYRVPGKNTYEYTAKVRIDYSVNNVTFSQSDFVIINI